MTRQEEQYQEYLAEKERRESERLYKKVNKRYITDARFFTVFRVDKFKYKMIDEIISSKDIVLKLDRNNLKGDNQCATNSYFTNNAYIDGLAKFQRHNNRQGRIENADAKKKHLNRIVIGSENVIEDVKMYLEGVKIHKNSVVAREIVLSAGNGFWNRLSDQDRERWIKCNVDFLKKYFGDNCVYSILHLDETTPHLHALIVPVMFDKNGQPHLNNRFYFNGKDKMAEWQDRYTEAMTQSFPNLFKRGIRGSKATHVDLKTFYSLVKEDLDELNTESILANAKENYINKKKVQELQEVIGSKEEQLKLIDEILAKNKELQQDTRLYEYTIKMLADKYKIPQVEVYKIFDDKISKDNNKNKGVQRERE